MNIKKEVIIGILTGLLFNFAGIYIYLTLFTEYDLITAINYAFQDRFLGGLIAIGASANFIPFFVYLKKDKIYRARGVLVFTIIMAFVILGLKIHEFYAL